MKKILTYFAILAFFMMGASLFPDGYYYWDWSKHLQLSYFDGSPLIAYVIRLYTTLFGPHEFSIYLIGLTAAGITGWLIYRIAFLLFDQEVAVLALSLWWLTPGVIRYFFFQVNYNTVLITFWALTLYAFVKLTLSKRRKDFYLCGAAIGFMLLAKYTGILLCCALLIICLCYKKYRFILRSGYFYAALLLALIIFSPVLIWNYQHQWISFLFQLQHGYHAEKTSVIMQLGHYIVGNLMDYNIPFIFLLWLGFSQRRALFSERLAIVVVPTLVVWLFFAISALFAMPQTNWNAPFYFTGAILLAYLFSQYKFKKYFIPVTLIATTAASFILVLGNWSPLLYLLSGPGWSGVYAMENMLENTDPTLYDNKLIFADDYQLLSYATHFLPKNPPVYSMSLGGGHQYYLWWQERAKQALPASAIYFSYQPLASTTVDQLRECEQISHREYIQRRLLHDDYMWDLYVYQCKL